MIDTSVSHAVFENTPQSMRLAVGYGAAMVEIDVAPGGARFARGLVAKVEIALQGAVSYQRSITRRFASNGIAS